MDEEEAGGLSATMDAPAGQMLGDSPGKLDAGSADLARQYLKRGLDPAARSASDQALADLSKSSEASRQALREARARLIALSKPDNQRKMFDLAAALMSTTKSGRTSESIGKAAASLRDNADLEARKRAAEAQGLLSIDTSLGGIDEKLGTARLNLAKSRENLESEEARAAMRALKASASSSGNPAEKLITSMIGNNVTGDAIAAYIDSTPEIKSQLSPAFLGNFRKLVRGYAPWVGALNGGVGAVTKTDTGVGSPNAISTAQSTAAGEGTVASSRAAGTVAGTAEANRVYAQPEAESALKALKYDLAETKRIAEEIKSSKGLENATGLMSLLPSFAGGQARDVQETIETLKIKTGLNALLNLKAAGGTLGQVTETEGRWLQNSIASLERIQSPEQFKRKVQEIITRASRMGELADEAYNRQYGKNAPTMAIVADAVRGGGSAPAKADNVKTFDQLPSPGGRLSGKKLNGPNGVLKSDGTRWYTEAEWTAAKGSKTW